MSPRIAFFIFVSVSCIRSGRWIHQIHSGGQTSYKIRQKCVDRRKPRAAMFVVNFSPFKSRASFARFSRAWRMRVTNSPVRKLVPATFTLAFSLIRNATKCSYITGWCSSKMLQTIFLLIVSISNSFPSAMNICFFRFQVYATMHMLSVANFQNGGQAK